MSQRLISAAVLVPVAVIVFIAGQPLISIAVLIVTVLAAHEVSRLLTMAGMPALSALSISGACIAVIAIPFALTSAVPFAISLGGYVAIVAALAVVVSLVADLSDSKSREWLGSAIGVLYPALLAFVVAILYVAPSAHPGAPLVGVLDYGRKWLLVLVLTVWALDTCAYVVGRVYPRGQMAPRISPRKTWSGAIGGTVAAVVVAALLALATGEQPIVGAALGLIIAVAAQAGDLTESLLKRRAGVKDSGALIPGHGGILDRVDSFLFAAPAMFLALTGIQLLTTTRPV